jgi:hypothetical protein
MGADTRLSRAGVLLVAALALCAWLPAAARAGAGTAQRASMSVRFTPERLGAPTALSLGVQIASDGRSPSALSTLRLAYPADLGFATSGLGLASCSPGVLEAEGPTACPPDSKMGFGSATVELPLEVETVMEKVSLEVFAGPSPDGYLHVLVYVSGIFPVEAQVVLSGVLLRGQLSIVVPPIPSFPEAPDVELTEMRLTLGGRLTYYERVAGRLVPYHPPGIGLPGRCPDGGFAFAATFVFLDGSRANAQTAVPCPRRR